MSTDSIKHIHELEVDATAVLLKRLLKYDFAGPGEEQRRSAIVKVFRWITGYNSLDEAARSHDERCFTGQGLRNPVVVGFEEDEFIPQGESSFMWVYVLIFIVLVVLGHLL